LEKIKIGGRMFVPVKNSTIEHDFWLMAHIRGAGLDRIAIEEGEPPEEFAVRLLGEVISSGRIFPILGGLFLPEKISSLDWTPEVAEETAAFLKKVSDPDDKALIQQQVVSLLISFFQSGLVSLRISQRSLGTGPRSTSDSGSGGRSISGTGE
jgi:hypothetical protein